MASSGISIVEIDRLSMYSNLIKEANLAESENEVFQIAARYTANVLNVDRCSIALVDKSDEYADLVALDGENGAIPIGQKVPLKGTMIGDVIRNQEIIVVNDIPSSDYLDLKKLSSLGAQSSMDAPLVSGGKVFGSLNTMRVVNNSYTDDDKRIIEHVAGILSANIIGRRLFEDLKELLLSAEESAKRKKILFEISTQLDQITDKNEILEIITSCISQSIQTHRVSISLLADDREHVELYSVIGKEAISQGTSIPLKRTALGKTISNRTQLTIQNIFDQEWDGLLDITKLCAAELASCIITPMVLNEQSMGTINVAHAGQDFYSFEEKIFLSNIAALAALKLDSFLKSEELVQKNKELIRADRIKSTFLANMSHEIRTPMNGVIGMTSLLLETSLTDEQDEFVNIIRTSGNSLLTIINDILDFSKIEANKLILEKIPFDIRTCVNEALDLVKSKATHKGLELLFYIDDNVPAIVTSDITRLRQILVNLLSNAIKFTDQGEVFISVSAEQLAQGNYTFKLSVLDTGIGIPSNRLDSLFDAFSQVDSSTSRKHGGTGLGLSISSQLAKMLGGGLTVESEVGIGSTFHLTIVADAEYADNEWDLESLRGKHALVVDDNMSCRKITSSLLKSWEMTYTVVPSAIEALSVSNKGERFDVAIIDLQMPDMDGFMLAHTLNNHRLTHDLPIIMLGPIGQRPDISLDTVKTWLSKPLKPDHLYKSLTIALSQNAGFKEVEESQSTIYDEELFGSVRILLAEDNRINKQVAMRMLHHLGCRVDAVANGLEVLEALERVSYDIILMDMMMPEMDGIEATIEIRKNLSVDQPIIIALTASAMEEDRNKCLGAGMNDYLSKPFKTDELAYVLATWISSELVQP